MKKIDLVTLRRTLAQAMRDRSPLPLLRMMFETAGRVFQLPLPGFKPYVVAGALANRKILVVDRNKLLWRNPDDPVTKLLRRGVLVVDGPEHETYRNLMESSLAPAMLPEYTQKILGQIDRVTATWVGGSTVDMLIECRRISLLVIMDTLFSIDFWNDMPGLWKPILKMIEYISPGGWIFWPGVPRPGFRKYIQEVDGYLYRKISERRSAEPRKDLLGHLIAGGLDDDCIRDQMLTMLIAGHDTATALLSWTFYLLGTHPDIATQLEADLDQSLKGEAPRAPSGWQPPLLDNVIKESLRLYPPIHIGNRLVKEDFSVEENTISAGERLMYSIYLSHRDQSSWDSPDDFVPGRFLHGRKHPPYAYVPFGGGPRACIGAAFGQVEARLVIARLLQTFRFQYLPQTVTAHMGATLEPRPGVMMKVDRK